MFRNQLQELTKRDAELAKTVSIFSVQVYMKPWFTASDATSAPRTDLNLLAQLRNYHHPVGSVAAAKLEGHLWYISPELALF